ncbi:MAG: hypothetical protein JSW11_12465 [Candidatus Heimdallarchaeota archaeon]|nr:MAG: hypothetical protein JSW11_12465 [Candidatus Heimdallarchaeota archaeon]
MTDSKDIEQLKADLELVTKTAKVLANKLEKISQRFEQLFITVEGISTIPQAPSQKIEEIQPTPKPAPAPTPSAQAVSSGGSTKAGRLLDSFLGQVQTMTKGKEISKLLSRLRDQVMQSAEVGFHPAFHEMGRYADQIKNISEITAAEKEQLFEKIYDWKARLTG